MDIKKTASSFLNQILAQIAEIKNGDLIDPEAEVNPLNDNFVGVASIEAMKLYTLSVQIRRKISQLTGELKKLLPGSSNRGIIERKIKEISENRSRLNIVNNLFWFCINSEFDLWDKSETGIRKGFKVIWKNEDRIQELIDLLGGTGD